MRLYSLQCDSTYIIFFHLWANLTHVLFFFFFGGGVEQDEVGKNSLIALPRGPQRANVLKTVCP